MQTFSAEKQCGRNGGFRLKIDEAGGADLAALSKDYCRQGQVFPISFSAAVTIPFLAGVYLGGAQECFIFLAMSHVYDCIMQVLKSILLQNTERWARVSESKQDFCI